MRAILCAGHELLFKGARDGAPADQLPAAALKAWRAVLPRETLVFAVGGIRPDNMAAYWTAGADGFGTGSNLYAPGADPAAVRAAAAAYAAALRALPPR